MTEARRVLPVRGAGRPGATNGIGPRAEPALEETGGNLAEYRVIGAGRGVARCGQDGL
jgi:hypothetical protein